jgi:hypothetical protein
MSACCLYVAAIILYQVLFDVCCHLVSAVAYVCWHIIAACELSQLSYCASCCYMSAVLLYQLLHLISCVLFPSVEQRNATGKLCPAIKNCTTFKNRSPIGYLGRCWWPHGCTARPQVKPGESIPWHMAEFVRITCLEMWDSCPHLFINMQPK